jgi:hypothetical protein
MKYLIAGAILAIGLTAGCATAAPAPAAPPPTVTSIAPVVTSAPTTTTTPTTSPTSTSVSPATKTSTKPKTSKSSVRKTPTRQPPTYGYQCRDGDEAKYQVCAGHKAWVDGQVEFTNCLDSGGTWDNEQCVRP